MLVGEHEVPARGPVREEAYDWLEEARADLARARRALEGADYSISCFFSQQAIEKALKAIIIGLVRQRPPHMHDLTALYQMAKPALELPDELVELLPEVSQYYATARYPNAGLRRPSLSFSRTQAQRALEVAERVLKHVEEALAAS